MSEKSKTIIIGLDGVPFDMLKGFADDGTMPNTAKLISGGTFRKMRSSIPDISSVAWSSIITGVNPAQHGIFGFVDLHPKSYKMCFPNFSTIKADPFWTKTESKSVIVNVPSTYPVKPMNGVHISGFVSIDFAKSVHPLSIKDTLLSLDYRLDVDAMKARESMDLFLKDVDQTLDARIEAYRYLWETQDFETFMLVFTGTDRLLHFLWDAYEQKDHQYHEEFVNHFRKIDKAIGEILDRIDGNDNVLMLSDHGFERLDHEVYINYLLEQNGFLSFKDGTDPGLDNICAGTKAFSMDPARIYLNLKGKYPAGSVDLNDREVVLNDLTLLLSEFEIDGKKVIKHIYKKEDVYAGPHFDEAPDLILISESGFNLKGSMASRQLSSKGVFTGKHTYNDAFILVNNPAAAESLADDPSVIEAGKLITKLVTA
jgi:predicted AlkP superfamily phosphohydrolase/phosphomutase